MKVVKRALLFFILIIGLISCSESNEIPTPQNNGPVSSPTIETFTFASSGISEGKIYLPVLYETNKDLPVIYLIDFQEQHFEVAKDEFEKVIDAVKAIIGFDAIVVTLAEHHNISTQSGNTPEYFSLFKSLAAYVDANYETNASKTLIGRGSEAGVILLSLFQESGESHNFTNFVVTGPPTEFISLVNTMVTEGNFPNDKENMRLHYSFSENYELSRNTRMINNIQAKNYPWLTFGSAEYPDLTFETAYPRAYTEGIKFVFDN